jgi:ATP-binding cassette subfamily B protein
VVIDNGRVTERGSHDDLLALGGRYATMFRVQADRFGDGHANGNGHGNGSETGATTDA